MTKVKFIRRSENHCRVTPTRRYPKRNILPVNYHENFSHDEQKRILQNIYPHLRTKKWLKEYFTYYRYYGNRHFMTYPFENTIANREWKQSGITINAIKRIYYCIPSICDVCLMPKMVLGTCLICWIFN